MLATAKRKSARVATPPVTSTLQCECGGCGATIPMTSVRRVMVAERPGAEPNLVQVDAHCDPCNRLQRVICAVGFFGSLVPVGDPQLVTGADQRAEFFLAIAEINGTVQVA